MDNPDVVKVLYLDSLTLTPGASAQTVSLLNISWFVQDVDELLQRVCNAESVHELYQFGSALLQQLQRARQRRHDIVTEEMKAVMEERDASIFKVTCSVSSPFCDLGMVLLQLAEAFRRPALWLRAFPAQQLSSIRWLLHHAENLFSCTLASLQPLLPL